MWTVLHILLCVRLLLAQDNSTTTTTIPTSTLNSSQDSEQTTTTTVSYPTTTTVSTGAGLNNVSTTSLPQNTSERPQSTLLELGASGLNLEVYNKSIHPNICTCDLQKYFCDINCCCDQDCSFEDKQVFQSCKLEPNFHKDTTFCDYIDYAYVNNTPYAWEVNQNSLFCIAKANIPTQYTVQKDKPLLKLEEAAVQKYNKYSWSDASQVEFKLQFNPNESFVYGSNVWIIKNNLVTQFELPDSFITNACLIKENVKFLHNFKRTCSQTELNAGNPHLNALNYFSNFTVVRAPSLLNNFTYQEGCPKNICLPIETKICDENYDICTPLISDSNGSNLEIKCNATVCLNAAQTVKYNFYHNGTRGFTRIELFLVLKNISRFFEEFSQQFEVAYFWWNYSTNYSLLMSGNPGYIIGKPLLIGNLVPIWNTTINSTSNTTTENIIGFTINRNSYDISENFLIFPANKEGDCVLNNRTYIPTEFGYNMITKCKLRKHYSIKNENTTATDLCVELQKDIFSYWPISHRNFSDINRMIGSFGNANESILNDWLKIISNKSPAQILNETRGNFTQQNTSLYCQNIFTTLKIDVFHSRVDIKDLLNQEKVIGVSFTFTNSRNFSFDFNFESHVREEIMFYDITSERIQKYVDPPAFKITLPYDFFYPFIKIDSSSCSLSHSNFVFVFCVLIYLGLLL